MQTMGHTVRSKNFRDFKIANKAETSLLRYSNFKEQESHKRSLKHQKRRVKIELH